jgi:hypothetical protein
MKKRISTLLALVLIGSGMFLSSCEKSEDGPDVKDRDKFLGLWKASSDGPSGGVNFNMTITASNSSESQVFMENFDALGNGTYVSATVTGNSIFIPRNLVHSDTIQGDGLYHRDETLSFNYEVRDGQTVESRTATARR